MYELLSGSVLGFISFVIVWRVWEVEKIKYVMFDMIFNWICYL